MKAIDTKQQLLDDAGFSYDFDREIYVNRKARRSLALSLLKITMRRLWKSISASQPAPRNGTFTSLLIRLHA